MEAVQSIEFRGISMSQDRCPQFWSEGQMRLGSSNHNFCEVAAYNADGNAWRCSGASLSTRIPSPAREIGGPSISTVKLILLCSSGVKWPKKKIASLLRSLTTPCVCISALRHDLNGKYHKLSRTRTLFHEEPKRNLAPDSKSRQSMRDSTVLLCGPTRHPFEHPSVQNRSFLWI